MLTTTLLFDKKTIASWQADGILAVSVGFIERGCEGTELAITTGWDRENKNSKLEARRLSDTNIDILAQAADWEKLENARVTQVWGKWIFTSEAVKRRCGCGSSFSFSDEDRISRDFPKIATANFSLFSCVSHDALVIRENQHTIVDIGKEEESEIRIPSGTTVVYRGLFSTGNRTKIRFVLEDHAKLDARFLIFASGGHAHADMEVILEGSDTNADIEYRAFGFEDAEISANTHIDICAGLQNATGHIRGKNIFFADRAKISGIPRVSAASDEIQAGHSLSFEKLSEIDEFFLQSRGIPERKARRMLAEAHIHKIFSDFPEGFEEVAQYLENAAASALE